MRSLFYFLGCVVFSTLPIALLPAAHAQSSTSREIVQPLPSAEVQRLNRSLLELARSPRSVAALLEAGDASLAVGDLDAAIGFYGNAAQMDPNNPRTKLGLARVYLRSGRPVEALPLLEEAQNAGAELREVLSARALAYDLVGDQEAAQTAYAVAIELAPQDDEVRRRLALSQAISGNEGAFQETLAPLLEARDVAAFRARAFGLAILGEQERAEAIVNSVMPPDLSARINPYLAYMPRLTSAQQAAAANLGIFPKAADIGREDPRIARFARESASGSRLEPAGEPLGTPSETPVAAAAEGEAILPAAIEAEPAEPVTDEQADIPTIATREIASSPSTQAPQAVSQESPQEAVQGLAPEVVQAAPASVADAFADLGRVEMPAPGRSLEAVDIAQLDVPREVAPDPQAGTEPAEPAHPRRIWVQLATGRDVNALGFDWRRFSRRAPDLLGGFEAHVTPWGQANRLLAGPIENAREARRLVNALSGKGIETFTYTSPEGAEIKELP